MARIVMVSRFCGFSKGLHDFGGFFTSESRCSIQYAQDVSHRGISRVVARWKEGIVR
jgi:hypothetical protein